MPLFSHREEHHNMCEYLRDHVLQIWLTYNPDALYLQPHLSAHPPMTRNQNSTESHLLSHNQSHKVPRRQCYMPQV